MADILTFNLLPNERLESSWGALGSVFGRFLVLMEWIVGFRDHGRNPKI